MNITVAFILTLVSQWLIWIFSHQIIGVDLSHIENKVSDIVKHDKNLIVVQGELIDK